MNKPTNTFDAILTCARALIATGGYNGFSYADIADVVGIRKASIHHHFPAKADLVKTLVTRYREEVETGIGQLEQGIPDPLAQLQAYIGYWKTCIGDASAPFCVCALLASEMPTLPPNWASMFFSCWACENTDSLWATSRKACMAVVASTNMMNMP